MHAIDAREQDRLLLVKSCPASPGRSCRRPRRRRWRPWPDEELPRSPTTSMLRDAAIWEVVEHDHKHATLEGLAVGEALGLDEPAGGRTRAGRARLGCHESEGRDILRLPPRDSLNPGARDRDEASVAIEDRVHLDVVEFDAKGYRWLVPPQIGWPAAGCCAARRSGQAASRPTPSSSCAPDAR